MNIETTKPAPSKCASQEELKSESSKNKKIKIPDEIVTHIKKLIDEVGKIAIPDDIDFMGCSASYVVQKISALRSSLDFYEERIREVVRKKHPLPDGTSAQWVASLDVKCSICHHEFDAFEVDDVWDGNSNIKIMDENKHKSMDFECPKCEGEISITKFYW